VAKALAMQLGGKTLSWTMEDSRGSYIGRGERSRAGRKEGTLQPGKILSPFKRIDGVYANRQINHGRGAVTRFIDDHPTFLNSLKELNSTPGP